jgi:signal transduction histidine kinase
MALKSRSLFWTFAGVFTLVLVAATAVQIAVTVGVFRPLAASSSRERAESLLADAAGAIASLPAGADDEAIAHVLRAHRSHDDAMLIVLLRDGRRMLAGRFLPPPFGRDVHALAVQEGLIAAAGDAGPRGQRPDDPAGLGPGGDGGGAAPPPGEGPPEGPPPGGGPPQGEDGAPPFAPRDQRLELVAHRPAIVGGTTIGTLAAVASMSAGNPWRGADVRALLLFMPFAVLAAGIAGLHMVRVMVGRLRVLEGVAGRVEGGDLAARVEARGADEIGRLEERFNRMTEGLQRSRAELEEGSRQRRQLFADITHELATPLTTIRGCVETLLDPAVASTPEEREAFLRDVLAESTRLDHLVRELMDLARLEAGAQPLSRSRLDWMALCRNTTRRFEPRFREARLKLEWEGPASEAWVVADGRRLEQVIENLLGNALRYVPAGGTVRVSLAPAAADGGRFRLAVRDDGPGIRAEDLPHLFERFYRARTARDDGGTGLGLAIVREIVLRHGGEVRAEAAEPRGAAFIVELPAGS